ncbi:MAG: FAD-binding oxidoreductase, partial [Bdellovibrionales bacterium]|nr:FAD-binding oxidoreductase [Bdellovibrionales bacterium]
MNSNKFKMDWWRWGNSSQTFSLKNKPGIASYTKEILNTEIKDNQFEKKINDIQLPSSTLTDAIKNDFLSILGHDNCKFDQYERITHALGKSYYDMLKIRSSIIKYAPDIIVYPATVDQIQKIIQICTKNKIAIIPFGGGSSVVGGIDSRKGNNEYSCCIDLSLMNKVISIDKESMLAEIEGGIFGPELEEELSKEGFTLGHFPQSFEFSTLGGWIATRSSGQNSILYGGIEKLVNSMTVINSNGILQTFNTPRMAVGPNMNEILLGSEGRFGIISSATMKIKPIPNEKKYI